ncbi:MAG: hypothetical protein LBR26_03395, partial [Prevotella sp.]|nr:hypothetical protein [Prevotella sp.]
MVYGKKPRFHLIFSNKTTPAAYHKEHKKEAAFYDSLFSSKNGGNLLSRLRSTIGTTGLNF